MVVSLKSGITGFVCPRTLKIARRTMRSLDRQLEFQMEKQKTFAIKTITNGGNRQPELRPTVSCTIPELRNYLPTQKQLLV